MDQSVDTRAFLARAQQYCAMAERCDYEVQTLLMKYGATSEQVDDVLQALHEQNYLSDMRYCDAFVHDKSLLQAWGRRKIEAALRAKRLPQQSITEALSRIDEHAYRANMRTLLRSKQRLEKDKQIRYMLQRGYTFTDLRSVDLTTDEADY